MQLNEKPEHGIDSLKTGLLRALKAQLGATRIARLELLAMWHVALSQEELFTNERLHTTDYRLL